MLKKRINVCLVSVVLLMALCVRGTCLPCQPQEQLQTEISSLVMALGDLGAVGTQDRDREGTGTRTAAQPVQQLLPADVQLSHHGGSQSVRLSSGIFTLPVKAPAGITAWAPPRPDLPRQ